MTEPATLHIYDDGEDIVIAESPEAASAIMDEMCDDPHDGKWSRFTATYDFYEEEDGPLVTKTVAEWVAKYGRGYMGSYNC